MSAVPMVFGSTLTSVTFVLVVVVACFNPGTGFSLLFQKFPNFSLQIYSLGLWLDFTAGLQNS